MNQRRRPAVRAVERILELVVVRAPEQGVVVGHQAAVAEAQDQEVALECARTFADLNQSANSLLVRDAERLAAALTGPGDVAAPAPEIVLSQRHSRRKVHPPHDSRHTELLFRTSNESVRRKPCSFSPPG